MNSTELYDDIRSYCAANADDAIVKKYSKFFKEGYDAYGLEKGVVDKKIKSIFSDYKITMKVVQGSCRKLVKSHKYEETFFAILLLKEYSDKFTAETIKEIGKWFELGIVNWAHTDSLCGDFFPIFFENKIITLKAISYWRTAKNKYQRRAVPVAMISLLKLEKDYKKLFSFIEPIMLDEERKVQQALGWFLREAWKIKRKETEKFLLKYKDTAPRTIIQYATEKMTAEEKKRFKRNKK
ncbi:MAG: DNA alkylation repair protein [Planctomycetota bacterium]|jgi:3-methyladenine DNA glycosylase AlkD